MVRSIPWTWGQADLGAVASMVEGAQWVYDARAKGLRVFTLRVREAQVEFGHTRSDDPALDTED